MGYIGSQPATNFETVRKQVSTTNSGTTITLDYSVSSVQDILVTVNAVVQSYDNYSVSGTTLTLGGTLNNDRVEILYVGRTFQTVSPAVGTVTNDMLAGSITNSKLANSSITLNGSAVSLGGSATISGTHVLLDDTYISSSTASVTYSSSLITDTYEQYIITGSAIQMASSGGGNLQLAVSTDNGSSYYTTNGNYKRTVQVGQTGASANTTINRAGDDAIVGITGNGYDFGGGVAYGNCGFVVRCYNLRNLDTGSGARRLFDVRSSYADKDSSEYVYNSGTHFFGGATGEINNLKIQCSHSNTIGEGEFRLYGVV